MDTNKTITTISDIAQHLLEAGAISSAIFWELVSYERNMLYKIYKLHEQMETKSREWAEKMSRYENQEVEEDASDIRFSYDLLQSLFIDFLELQLQPYGESYNSSEETDPIIRLNLLIEQSQVLNATIREVLTDKQLYTIVERLKELDNRTTL